MMVAYTYLYTEDNKMDMIQIFDLAITAIGGIVVLLGVISPFTKATWDDKLLLALKNVTNNVKVSKEDSTVLIQVPKK